MIRIQVVFSLGLVTFGMSRGSLLESTDYCGTADIPPYSPPSSLDSEGSPVDSVHVFFRHGTRTDVQRNSCFPGGAQSAYTCRIGTEFGTEFGRRETPHRISKKYQKGCEMAQILDYASVQMDRLGDYLLQAYGTRIASLGSSQNSFKGLYFRSTDVQRTLGSMDLLLSRLFQNESLVAPVETDEFDSDSLTLAYPLCPRTNQLNAQFQASPELAKLTNSSSYFQTCAKRWLNEIGTEFNFAQAGDCLLSPLCGNGTFPHNLAPSPELIQCVSNIYAAVRQLKYNGQASSYPGDAGLSDTAQVEWNRNSSVEICSLATGKFMRDLASSDAMIGLWATHDDTLACMLSQLGLWNGEWPKYASFVVFEKFENGKIRVIRDGKEIGWKTSMSEIVPERIMNETMYENACRVQDPPPPAPTPWWNYLLRVLGVIAVVLVIYWI